MKTLSKAIVANTQAAAAAADAAASCRIDERILNENSIGDMDDIALSFFASLCGKNRGAFVLDPPDGQTYGCLSLPSNVAELAGLEETMPLLAFEDANSINEQFLAGNITSNETLSLLNFLIDRVYQSTPSQQSNPYACDFNGLTKLSCDDDDAHSGTSKEPLYADHRPVRSVTLQGWLPDDDDTSTTTATETISYTAQDFEEMVELAGLNTVQIVLPMSVFSNNNTNNNGKELLSSMLEAMQPTGLKAILALEYSNSDENDDSFNVQQSLLEICSYAAFTTHKDVVLAVTLPRGTSLTPKQMIETIRASVGPELALLVPMDDSDFVVGNNKIDDIDDDDPRVYGSLEWYHTNTIGDIASSTSQDDRSKLFYHESLACIQRAPLEHLACHQNMPVIWTFGFDLTIDDCAAISSSKSSSFKDYGQCDRFDETIASDWWDKHRQSFAARQIYAAEQGLGWSFASWKLSNDDDDDSDSETTLLLDAPAKLASLRDVVRAGLFPKNFETDLNGACLNPPQNNFILGDDTLAPTMGPPPDCGNGWWNYTTLQCDYWIPPPEPTLAPTEPCPECECPPPVVWHQGHSKSTAAATAPALAFVAGVLVTLLLGFILQVRGKHKQRSGYSVVPDGNDEENH